MLVAGPHITDRRIQLAETLTWRWPQFKGVQVYLLVIWLVAGLVYGLIYGLVAGLVYWLVAGLVVGLSGLVTGEITTRSRPNEGIRRSWHNALLSGLVAGLVVGLCNSLAGWMVYRQVYGGLVLGLTGGLSFGVVVGLTRGGNACLQHLMLRFLLWRNNYAPWHYVRFLDYAAERVFLHKVGGGYVFIHRMLLEYFATLYPPNSDYKDEALTIKAKP